MRNRVLKLFSFLLTAIMVITIMPIANASGKLGGDVNAAETVTFSIRTYGDPKTDNFGYIVEPNVDYKVPCVLFFHGLGGIKKEGETETWPERLAKDMSQWIAQGYLEPCTFIVPRVNLYGKKNYEQEYKDCVLAYLPGILESVKAGTFSSTIDTSKPMTVCGISLGGVCSLYVGYKFKDDFVNVGALSAGRQFCWLYQAPDTYTGMIYYPNNIAYSDNENAHRMLACSKTENNGEFYQYNLDYYNLLGEKWEFEKYYPESGEHVRSTFMNEFFYYMYFVQHDTFPTEAQIKSATISAAPITGKASVSGKLTCGETLKASIEDTNASALTYQWTRNGKDIEGATSATYVVSGDDVGCEIACKIGGSSNGGYVTGKIDGKPVKKVGPAAPNATGVSPSKVNGDDGKITGVDATMEYDISFDFPNPKKVTANEITGLFAGDYYVRVAETSTTEAGAVKKVYVALAVSQNGSEENSEEKTDLSFEDLVERLYVVALGRDSEPEGKKFWCDEVQSGRRTGSDCALGFLLSEEFINKGLTNDEFVEVLYKTYFDRASEAEGKAYWVNALNSGSMDRITVIRCFADSREWCDVCARYGVKSGAPTAKATVASSNATKFATRLYTECLGRDAEEDGLKYWSLALTNLEKTGTLAAKEFFYSDEFVGKNTTNEAYVKCLYRTFMGRDAEDDGLNYWVGQLEKGESRASVLEGFANSKEFTEICASYGIDR